MKLKDDSAFTLLEIIIVIGIIALLAAFAVQQFAIYRSQGTDTEMRSDLKNAAIAMESYFAEYRSYPTSVTAITAKGFRQTSGVALTIAVTSPSTFTLTASKPNGTQASFVFDSSTGSIN
jgi:prepilin-type N-terminal cleavage/methylation domain-containing protein